MTILPGYGHTTGKQLATHPLVRKVDITVRSYSHAQSSSHRRSRLVPELVERWEPSLARTSRPLQPSWEERSALHSLLSNWRIRSHLYQAPILIFDDADVVSAVNGVAFASFIASGQTCVSGTRIIIQENIYESFMMEFLRKVESITQGMGDRESYIMPSVLMNNVSRSYERKMFYGLYYISPPPE